ncbi:MAG: Rrf2 family transcriptional regulator [Clostridiales bacterium]|nr:Rrf2 family transcriptional regulator [Clostridiales bacterium]
MNISTKGRYGLRAILDIARHGEGRPVTLSAIALRQQISEGYLEQLMAPMKKAGLVQSSRGAQGGYTLAGKPQEIVVGDIFRALEGPLALASCISEADEGSCHKQESCGSRFIWEEIQKAVSQVLASYTLADLLERETTNE